MANLPDYVASAKPNPLENRAPWWKNTAQTYAGIMLWFVFWTKIPGTEVSAINPAGLLTCGLGTALAALVLAAILCHFLFYLVPGKLGLKTGLPLYIVGTSTYGVKGGFLMPGFLMGLLQYGWLAVNAWGSGTLFTCMIYGKGAEAAPSYFIFYVIAIVWACAAAFVGLKGIKYVAGVATWFPIIPIVVLLALFVGSMSGISKFDPAKVPVPVEESADKTDSAPQKTAPADPAPAAAAAPAEKDKKDSSQVEIKPLTTYAVFNLMLIYILGFFATAGAAGCDMGAANRDSKDIQLGGLVGIVGSTVFAGGLSLAICAGAYGNGCDLPLNETTDLMNWIMGGTVGKVFLCALAIAAFPSACFCSMIAANSFKTTLPKVPPFITCGLGVLGAIALIVTKLAGDAPVVFGTIGASFGPICGAMAADYILSGFKWNGPRAGFNPAGWISWFFGFVVGAYDFFLFLQGRYNLSVLPQFEMPCPPLLACIVGFVLYFILAAIGCKTRTLPMDETNA